MFGLGQASQSLSSRAMSFDILSSEKIDGAWVSQSLSSRAMSFDILKDMVVR